MRWPALLPLLLDGWKGPPPHILLIHLGGNDLGLTEGKALIIQAKEDLAQIKEVWPGVILVFLVLLPHRIWRGLGDPRYLDRARQEVNREMRKAMLRDLVQFLSHPGI